MATEIPSFQQHTTAVYAHIYPLCHPGLQAVPKKASQCPCALFKQHMSAVYAQICPLCEPELQMQLHNALLPIESSMQQQCISTFVL
jgi:hypothetical protein